MSDSSNSKCSSFSAMLTTTPILLKFYPAKGPTYVENLLKLSVLEDLGAPMGFLSY